MRSHWLEIDRDFTLPPQRVFEFLSEHENLGPLFGAKVQRLRDGEQERNGVGSVRRLRVAPGAPPIEETITEFERPQRIVYKITRGGPLRDHIGIMQFSETETGGTHLNYRIRFASRLPGVAAIVMSAIGRNIRKGLGAVDKQA